MSTDATKACRSTYESTTVLADFECALPQGHAGPHVCLCGCGTEWTAPSVPDTTRRNR